jgi:23S rRNA pseudouridine1911/1915/1917 synthase
MACTDPQPDPPPSGPDPTAAGRPEGRSPQRKSGGRHRRDPNDPHAERHHHTERTSPLIGPGGKISRAGLFRQANAASDAVHLPSSAGHGQGTGAPAGSTAPHWPGAEDSPEDDRIDEGEYDDEPAAWPGPETGTPRSPEQGTPQIIEADAESDAPLASPTGVSRTPQKVVLRLKRDLDKRLDRYLVDRIPFMSRAQLQRLIEGGSVTVNARPAKASTRLHRGDVLEILLTPPESEDVPPQDLPLEVMYEDEHLIVLNKSPDIIVHPARSTLSGTMINALAYHFRHRSTTGGRLSEVGREFARPGVVHRLDRQTSGCIVFAKSERAHWQLANQFMDRRVEKRYLALVHGRVEPEQDVIDLPIGPHPSRERGYREKHVVRHDHLGKPALTLYRTLGRFRTGVADPGRRQGDHVGLVEIELKTGRTHQIRVHMSARGWPLVGDDMYGGRSLPVRLPDGAAVEIGLRVMLHAAVLAFRHPLRGDPMRFTAPLPEDFARALDALNRADAEDGVEHLDPFGAAFSVRSLLGTP